MGHRGRKASVGVMAHIGGCWWRKKNISSFLLPVLRDGLLTM